MFKDKRRNANSIGNTFYLEEMPSGHLALRLAPAGSNGETAAQLAGGWTDSPVAETSTGGPSRATKGRPPVPSREQDGGTADHVCGVVSTLDASPPARGSSQATGARVTPQGHETWSYATMCLLSSKASAAPGISGPRHPDRSGGRGAEHFYIGDGDEDDQNDQNIEGNSSNSLVNSGDIGDSIGVIANGNDAICGDGKCIGNTTEGCTTNCLRDSCTRPEAPVRRSRGGLAEPMPGHESISDCYLLR